MTSPFSDSLQVFVKQLIFELFGNPRQFTWPGPYGPGFPVMQKGTAGIVPEADTILPPDTRAAERKNLTVSELYHGSASFPTFHFPDYHNCTDNSRE